MGLMIHSLGELPAEAQRGYYLYVLDCGWDEPLENALRANFPKMAELASRHNAVVIQGTVGAHFADEVLSWHHINGQKAENILPAILITTRHPKEFQDTGEAKKEQSRKASEHRLILIPLQSVCRTPADVVRIALKIFADIKDRKELADFTVMSEMHAGKSGALADALVLQPNFAGVGLDVKQLAAFFKGKWEKRRG
jgi:hypothetical protein